MASVPQKSMHRNSEPTVKRVVRKRVRSQPTAALRYKSAQHRDPFLAVIGHFAVLGWGFLVGDLWLNHTAFLVKDLLIYPITAVPNSIVYPWFLFRAFTGEVLVWKLAAAMVGFSFSSVCFFYRFNPRVPLTFLNTCTFVGGITMVLIAEYFTSIF